MTDHAGAAGAAEDGDGGRVVTVFRSRLRPEAAAEYEVVAAEMETLARSMPGLVDLAFFVADDGERVTIATFASSAEQRAWREHPEHRRAQELGRTSFYETYSVQVCTEVRGSRFSR